MDPFRLPRHVRPTRYEIRLEPDLLTATFRGRETVTVEVAEATTEIVLNAVELTVSEATAESARGERQSGRITMDEPNERCHIGFASPLAPGTWRLTLGFTGTLND